MSIYFRHFCRRMTIEKNLERPREKSQNISEAKNHKSKIPKIFTQNLKNFVIASIHNQLYYKVLDLIKKNRFFSHGRKFFLAFQPFNQLQFIKIGQIDPSKIAILYEGV